MLTMMTFPAQMMLSSMQMMQSLVASYTEAAQRMTETSLEMGRAFTMKSVAVTEEAADVAGKVIEGTAEEVVETAETVSETVTEEVKEEVKKDTAA